MARAETASASAQTDSIKGLAQSIAKPAYRRLLTAEPALRRAVPTLIIAFLMTICVGAIVQVLDHRRQEMLEEFRTITAVADVLAERLGPSFKAATPETPAASSILEGVVPTWGVAAGRSIILTGRDARVLEVSPPDNRLAGKTLVDVLGAGQPLTTFGADAGVLEIPLADGTLAFATVRTLKPPFGQVAVIESKNAGLATWRSAMALTLTLSATTGFVVLILGFAFHWQATRAREADIIYEAVRGRIDTALNLGHCGLWDWDLARGRIFWSHSMFAILGLEARDDLLTFGEVNSLAHPEDIHLYDIAVQLADAKTQAIDHAFRMRHANGNWIWLRARCELVQQGRDPGHLIGIAIDITEQRNLVDKTIAADLRLRDAIETIPEAFVLWDADNRLVLCNSNFQGLHNLPDDVVNAGTSYETVVAAGRKPIVRNRITGEATLLPGARTFEAQLDDGRWLNISERRTKDGGYVSVGTDITTIKQHEEKLIESEKRLLATVTDLRTSQGTLERQTSMLADLAQKYSDEKTRAEEANAAKSSFLANMSHELRTPLNAIIGFSEIMESEMFGALGAPKYHEYCHDIRESGQFLLDVISDILDMSKIEAGRIRLNIEAVALDKILDEAMRVVSARADDKQLALSLKLVGDYPMRADRRAIKQVVLNLLSNAVKFTPNGGTITVFAKTHENGTVIAIKDSGIGITKHALARLGRPFEQVENQLTKSHQGSGLGLAIAKSLTELHGGTMRIRSKPEVGTIVLLRIPASSAGDMPQGHSPA